MKRFAMTRLGRKNVIPFLFLLMAAQAGVRAAGRPLEAIEFRNNVHVAVDETRSRVIAVKGHVSVDGTVEEDVVAVFGDVVVGSSGVVKGDAISFGGKIIREEGARVDGRIVEYGLPLRHLEKILLVSAPALAAFLAGTLAMAAVVSSIGFLALVVIVLVIFGKQVERVRQEIKSAFWFCLAYGLIGFIALVPILIFLFFTLVGIPLAFVCAAVAVAGMMLGVVGVAYALGAEVALRFKKGLNPILAGLLGVGLLFLLGMLPLFGWLVQLLALFLGLGAVIRTRFQS